MKFFKIMKDGGSESTVTGYWLVEIKSLFSIVLLKFEGKSREAYHTHAFNCWNWLVSGALEEFFYKSSTTRKYIERDFFTIKRTDFHKVDSLTPISWVLSIRGPWNKTWKEYLPNEKREKILTHGRFELA